MLFSRQWMSGDLESGHFKKILDVGNLMSSYNNIV